jgi:hypothetical protein
MVFDMLDADRKKGAKTDVQRKKRRLDAALMNLCK